MAKIRLQTRYTLLCYIIQFTATGLKGHVGNRHAHITQGTQITGPAEILPGHRVGTALREQIVNVSIDESVLDSDGKLDMSKFQPISFEPANNGYHVLGERVGNAFSDGGKLK